MTDVLVRRSEDTQRHRIEGDVKMGAEIGVIHLYAKKQRVAKSHRSLEEAKKDPLPEPSKGAWPLT